MRTKHPQNTRYAFTSYDCLSDLLRKHGGKTAVELKAEGK